MFYKYLNNDEDEKSLFINFKNFKKKIHHVFKKINEMMIVIHIIQHFK